MAVDRQMKQAFKAIPAAVGPARSAVTEFALGVGADPRKINKIALAVSEACANVAVHAYRDSCVPGEMVVTATVVDDDLRVQVTDYGVGMIPRLDSPGIGMGVPLMSQLADGFETKTSAGDGTEVCMRFSLRDHGAPCDRAPEPVLGSR